MKLAIACIHRALLLRLRKTQYTLLCILSRDLLSRVQRTLSQCIVRYYAGQRCQRGVHPSLMPGCPPFSDQPIREPKPYLY